MPNKEKLVDKLTAKPMPRDFTIADLDTLMKKCGCQKYQEGRGSGIGYRHTATNRALQFDVPHPNKELFLYQVRAIIKFLKDVGEIE